MLKLVRLWLDAGVMEAGELRQHVVRRIVDELGLELHPEKTRRVELAAWLRTHATASR